MSLQTRIDKLEAATGGDAPRVIVMFAEDGESNDQAEARWVAGHGPLPAGAKTIIVRFIDPAELCAA